MWFSKRRIYLDYASAPPLLPEAVAAMREAETLVGNPGAIHAEAVAAKKSLNRSRERIAEQLQCKAREIVFTSGLTDANNLAILGYAKFLERTRRTLQGTHWIVSSIEHDSVLQCFGEIERLGGDISFVDPDERGLITAEAVFAALRPESVFVSVGWANNEIGVVQPLGKIAQKIREHQLAVTFHSDAGQAPLYLPTFVHSLGVDLLALGANKLYGPHGVGALYVGKGATLAPVVFGGKQEHGLHAGTENIALAAGFAAAYEAIAKERDTEARRVRALRDVLARDLQEEIPHLLVNGDLSHALAHMLNVSIPHISSEYVTLTLDARGIAVSTKSACREGEESRSHVVAALGGEEWRAQNTLRFSLGRDTTQADIERTVQTLTGILSKA